jgi:hypothetical protein
MGHPARRCAVGTGRARPARSLRPDGDFFLRPGTRGHARRTRTPGWKKFRQAACGGRAGPGHIGCPSAVLGGRNSLQEQRIRRRSVGAQGRLTKLFPILIRDIRRPLSTRIDAGGDVSMSATQYLHGHAPRRGCETKRYGTHTGEHEGGQTVGYAPRPPSGRVVTCRCRWRRLYMTCRSLSISPFSRRYLLTVADRVAGFSR